MILAAIVILFFLSVLILGLSRFVTRPGYGWFIAVGGSLVAWVLVLLSFPQEVTSFPLTRWGSSTFMFTSPSLLLDRFSWPFAVAIATLLVSVILTDVARTEEIQASSWSQSLALTGFGLLSVLSGNPLTLALTWAALDIIDVVIRFQRVTNNDERESLVISFSSRIFGTMLLIPAIIETSTLDLNLNFSNISSSISGYLILAAGLRLGVLPPQAPFLRELPTRRGLGTQTRLIPVAASMVLLTRVAVDGVTPEWSLALIIAAALAVLYGALAWVWASDELDGRPFWILSLSAFAIVASIRSNPLGCQAWGLSMMFSGGLIFLYSTRDRRLVWLPILGLLGFSALPFTPAWWGLSIFSRGNVIFWAIFLFGLIALILGYYRHMMRSVKSSEEMERWVWIVYPLGLSILPLTHFWVVWSQGGIAIPDGGLLSLRWWVGLIVLGIILVLIYLVRSGYSWSPEIRHSFRRAVSIAWLYRTLWWIYRNLSTIINYFLRILEGDGGVLWAVLILILLFTFFIRSVGGA